MMGRCSGWQHVYRIQATPVRASWAWSPRAPLESAARCLRQTFPTWLGRDRCACGLNESVRWSGIANMTCNEGALHAQENAIKTIFTLSFPTLELGPERFEAQRWVLSNARCVALGSAAGDQGR